MPPGILLFMQRTEKELTQCFSTGNPSDQDIIAFAPAKCHGSLIENDDERVGVSVVNLTFNYSFHTMEFLKHSFRL